jgi:hypothetical protein
MPEDVQVAFREAIRLYADWKFGGAERALSFRGLQQVSLSGVCDLVLSYRNEPLYHLRLITSLLADVATSGRGCWRG